MWLVAALAGPSFVAVLVAGVVDLIRRSDLDLRRRVLWGVAIALAPAYAGLLYAMARPLRVDRVVVGAPAGPVLDQRRTRSAGARFVQQVAQLASVGLFRSVEVVRPAAVATRGPQLWIASHFGAFSDAVVLLHALERHPRFLVGDFLFRVPLLRQLLRLAEAIPVRRSVDVRADRAEGAGAGATANQVMFAASRAALADGDALAIFPEGVATDGPAISPLRTGAARIALGAYAEGVRGLQVVPVGIHYQDRAAFRSRVFVDVGEPVDLDGWLTDRGVAPEAISDADHALVRALTDDLERCLREVAPQFTDLEEAVALHAAARVALRDRLGRPPGWGPQADLADELGRRPATERQALCEAVRTYRAALDATGLGDVEVAERPARSRRRILGSLVLGVALVPFALAGAIVHAPLAGLVVLLRSLRIPAPTKATVLPAVALLGALGTWIGWALVLSADESGGARVAAVIALVLVFPLWGVAALVLVERVSLFLRVLRTIPRSRRRRTSALEELQAERERVVSLVGPVSPPGPGGPGGAEPGGAGPGGAGPGGAGPGGGGARRG
jgi:glycerol-3-phosphate O-acyltransferase / dihydroxyacetone phosphate acyltransferase